MDPVDAAVLNFNPTTLTILNVLIGFIMFGVALDIRVADFRRIVADPRGPAIGLAAQFLLLPFATFLLVGVLDPAPSVALGMILVAACPGGNFSNFLSSYARGNAALSVSMTAVSTLLAIVMTPFNLQFWGSRTPGAAEILTDVSLDPFDLMVTILLILGLPAGPGHADAGQAARARRPDASTDALLRADGLLLVHRVRADRQLVVLHRVHRLFASSSPSRTRWPSRSATSRRRQPGCPSTTGGRSRWRWASRTPRWP